MRLACHGFANVLREHALFGHLYDRPEGLRTGNHSWVWLSAEGMQSLLSVLAENFLELFPECTSTFRWHVTKESLFPLHLEIVDDTDCLLSTLFVNLLYMATEAQICQSATRWE